ncbi:hypothetical protein XENOCAPTIV_015186, partial [Xenoophorus captivus]
FDHRANLLPIRPIFSIARRRKLCETNRCKTLMQDLMFQYFVDLFKCGLYNFRRRLKCFRCGAAKVAIAAAQWSSAQVGPFSLSTFCLPLSRSHINGLFYTLQPQQTSDGMSEYACLQEGYAPLSQVGQTKP